MSEFAKLTRRVEATMHTMREIEKQHSKYHNDLAGLLKEVAECANQKRTEMMESKAQYEHIMDEYAQLKDLLHSPVLTSGASRALCVVSLDSLRSIVSASSASTGFFVVSIE